MRGWLGRDSAISELLILSADGVEWPPQYVIFTYTVRAVNIILLVGRSRDVMLIKGSIKSYNFVGRPSADKQIEQYGANCLPLFR